MSRAGSDSESSGLDTNELLESEAFLAHLQRMESLMTLGRNNAAVITLDPDEHDEIPSRNETQTPKQHQVVATVPAPEIARFQAPIDASKANMATAVTSTPSNVQETTVQHSEQSVQVPKKQAEAMLHKLESSTGSASGSVSGSASASGCSSGDSDVCHTARHTAPYSLSSRTTGELVLSGLEAPTTEAAAPVPTTNGNMSISVPQEPPRVREPESLQEQAQEQTQGLVESKPTHGAVEDDDTDDEDDDDDDVYVINWTHGTLGLKFCTNTRGETAIRRVSRRTGTAEGLQFSRKGDVLLAINDALVIRESMTSILARLQAPVFPVRLTFQPAQVSNDDEMYRPSSMADARFDMSQQRPSASASAASATVSVASPSIDASSDFEVIWSDGPLGCALKPVQGIPVVKSVSPHARVEDSVAQIAIGDVMIEINGINTEMIGFRAVVGILESGAKPIRMRFQRSEVTRMNSQSPTAAGSREISATSMPPPPSLPPFPSPTAAPEPAIQEPAMEQLSNRVPFVLRPNQYTVTWKGGPLGIQIKGSGNNKVVVSKHTGTGDPQLTNKIHIGDILLQIGDAVVQDTGIEAAFELLRHVEKPVTLVLERVLVKTPQFDPTNSMVPNLREQRMQERARLLQEEAARKKQEQALARQASLPQKQFSLEPDVVEWVESEHWGRKANLARKPSGGVNGNDRPSAYMSAPTLPTTARLPPPTYAQAMSPALQSPELSPSPLPRTRPLSATHSHSSHANVSMPPLPRFSDLEAGRIVATPVKALPPPPAYDELFLNNGPMNNAPPVPLPLPQNTEDGLHDTVFINPLDSERRYQQLRAEHMERERLKNQTPEQLVDPGTVRGPQSMNTARRPELWMRWCEGPLGITFRRSHNQIVVSRLTGAGRSPGLEELYPGDWLVRFGNEGVGVYMTKDLRLSETVAIIKRLPKPVDMWFITQ